MPGVVTDEQHRPDVVGQHLQLCQQLIGCRVVERSLCTRVQGQWLDGLDGTPRC